MYCVPKQESTWEILNKGWVYPSKFCMLKTKSKLKEEGDASHASKDGGILFLQYLYHRLWPSFPINFSIRGYTVNQSVKWVGLLKRCLLWKSRPKCADKFVVVDSVTNEWGITTKIAYMPNTDRIEPLPNAALNSEIPTFATVQGAP